MEGDWNEEEVNSVVEEYTNLRLKNCMLKSPEFLQKVKGKQNGHLYMKVLREQIVDELNLQGESRMSEITRETIADPARNDFVHDLETPYAMQSLNNT